MLPIIISELDADKNRNVVGQIGFFDTDSGFSFESEMVAPALEEMPKNELLALEKEITGLYITGHPMDEYIGIFNKLKCDSISDILENNEDFSTEYKDNSQVKIFCIITRVEKKITKNNSTMCFIEIEDIGASIECIVFSKLYADRINHLKAGNILLIRGRLSLREDREPSVICESIEPNPKNLYKNEPITEKAVKIDGGKIGDSEIDKLKVLTELFPGNIPVYINYANADDKVKLGEIKACSEIAEALKVICGDNVHCEW